MASLDKTIASQHDTMASLGKTIASLDDTIASRGSETVSRGLEIAIRGCFMEGLATKRAIMRSLLAEAFNCSTQKKLGLVAVFSYNEFTHSSLFYFIKKCKTNVLCK